MAITTCIIAASGFNTRSTLKVGGLNFRSAQFGYLGTDAGGSKYLVEQANQVAHDITYKRTFATSGAVGAGGVEQDISLPFTMSQCIIANRGAVPFYVNHNSSAGDEPFDGSGCFTLASGESITLNGITRSLRLISDTNTALEGYYDLIAISNYEKDLM